MVAAGEASGTLEAVLERLADFMEGQARLKGKVTAALAYPVLMMFIGIIMVGVLMVAVVPKVTSIFDNLGHALPWYTRLLIVVSNVVAGYWWLHHRRHRGRPCAVSALARDARGQAEVGRASGLVVPIFGQAAAAGVRGALCAHAVDACSRAACSCCRRWRSAGTCSRTRSSRP